MSAIEIAVPVFQGGMAVRISMAPLVATVSRAGGLGILGGSGLDKEELRNEIRKVKSEVGKLPFAVNIMAALSRFSELVRVCVEEKVPAIAVGAGFSREVFEVKKLGVKVFPIVSSLKAALLSERLGADAIILESGRAGGHLGTLKPLEEIATEVISNTKVPVVVAGGVETPEEARSYIEAGAHGVQIGTRFALSEESGWPGNIKEFFLNAKSGDVIVIESPAGLPARAVMSPFLEKVFSGIKPEPRIVTKCIQCLKKCSKKFCLLDSLICAQKGDLENGLFFSGDQLPGIKTIVRAKDLIDEYSRVLKRDLIISETVVTRG